MNLEQLQAMCTCFIAGGLTIPVFDVLIGVLSGGLDLGANADADVGADIDVGADAGMDVDVGADLGMDVDVGADLGMDVDVGADLGAGVDLDVAAGIPVSRHFRSPVAVNLMSLSFVAVVFGAIGKLTLRHLPPLPALLLAGAAGLAGGWLIGRYVLLPMKRSRPFAQNIRDLKGQEGIVKLELRDDFVGTIQVLSASGSKVTYSARPMEGLPKIAIGTCVRIVGVDARNQLCIVLPLE